MLKKTNTELRELIGDKQKLRLTRAREVIYKILKEAKKSIEISEIHEKINKSKKNNKNNKVDLVSVYRNLALFEELGIVHKSLNNKYTFCHQSHVHKCDTHIIVSCETCGSSKELQHTDKSFCDLANFIKLKNSGLSKVYAINMNGICELCVEN